MPTKTKSVLDLETLHLAAGSHSSPERGMCVMEAVAYLRGQPFSDRPPCVSPVIGAFLRAWNDSLNDDDRQKLKPYILKVVDTNTGAADDERRAWMAVDWLVRTSAPTWLDLAGLNEHAQALRAVPELSTTALASQALPIIKSARSAADAVWAAAGAAVWDAAAAAARDAAWAAAWDAAWAAAWAAAAAAARAAARAAAWDAAAAAARAAAWDAAWAAARDAAWAAARAAAWDAAAAAAWAAARAAAWAALRPTVEQLQVSAFDLLDRMIAVGKVRDA